MTPRRLRRGFASPFGVMLVAALAGASLAAWHAARDAERREALDRAGGRLFGTWVQAVHRAAQEGGAAARLGRALPAAATPAELRGLGSAVPPGLPDGPRRAVMILGTLDDGAGVETAFGVLEPAAGASAAAFRAGAAAAGLADVGEAGSASPMSAHLPAIAAAMGRQPAPGALYVTADLGLRYREGQLHRRAQPGRPWLNRMEAALDLGGDPAAAPPVAGRAVTGAGSLAAASATVSGTASAGGAVSVAGGAAVAGTLSAASMTAAQASSASLTASRRLTARSLRVAGAARAGGVRAAGRLAADSLAATGLLRAADLAIGRGFDATGTATVRLISAAALEAGGRLTARAVGASAAAGGPAAGFSGAVTAGSCTGCR